MLSGISRVLKRSLPVYRRHKQPHTRTIMFRGFEEEDEETRWAKVSELINLNKMGL